jgi:hypothetical protein
MSEASEFRQYADEALRWAAEATTEKERRSLLELARTWAEAATMMSPKRQTAANPNNFSRGPHV